LRQTSIPFDSHILKHTKTHLRASVVQKKFSRLAIARHDGRENKGNGGEGEAKEGRGGEGRGGTEDGKQEGEEKGG
jgi:hypothetical protein